MSVVGEHSNVRLALCHRVPTAIASPGAQGRRLPARALLLLLFCSLPQRLQLLWQQAIRGQPCLCMAVPDGGVARGNGAVWKAFQSPHLEHWELFIFLTRSSKIISPGQTPLVLNSGAMEKLRLGSGRGGTRPSHQRSTEPSATGPPHTQGHCSLEYPTKGWAAERGWAL